MSVKQPLIFDIRHFALDDGPGIRTTVFMKGCPLSCIWCHNPESFSPEGELRYLSHLCIDCEECLTTCPEQAIRRSNPDRIIRKRCTACFQCEKACPSTALRGVGRHIPVSNLTEILIADRIFYDTSSGGVTFSGGEPTLFMDYVGKVMKRLKEEGIHVAIETCGWFDLAEFKDRLLPFIDLIYFDLKLIDPLRHQRFTGKPNEIIIANFKALVATSCTEVIPRMPLVPHITATKENLAGIAAFLKDCGRRSCEFLPYHPGGIAKRRELGKKIPEIIPRNYMPRQEADACTNIFQSLIK